MTPRFSYYRKLSLAQKRIYDASDKVKGIRLPAPERFLPAVETLASALASEVRQTTEDSAQILANTLCDAFGVSRVRMRVLTHRPSRSWGELHGLYEATEGKHPVITVWMRTAQKGQVVKFRTFLRTVIHEFMHHLDYHWLKLADSFHTEGFFKRESSLTRALLGETKGAVAQRP